MKTIWIMAGAAALVMCSCEHKPLVYPISPMHEVRIDMEWRHKPDREPEGMAVYFYPIGRGQIWRFDLNGIDGGTVEIPEGEYNIITYNNDTGDILFRGENSFETLEAYCPDVSPLAGLGSRIYDIPETDEPIIEEPVKMYPDMLWRGDVRHVKITPESRVINVYPVQGCANYTYTIDHVVNLSSARIMCATMSGVANGEMLNDGALSSEAVTVPLAASTDGTSTIHGQFSIFGCERSLSVSHSLVLYVWLKDKRKLSYVFDVSKQVHDAPDSLNVHLHVSGLELPPVEPSDTTETPGLDVGIDGWTTIEISLKS